jgi:hypothetical protein
MTPPPVGLGDETVPTNEEESTRWRKTSTEEKLRQVLYRCGRKDTETAWTLPRLAALMRHPTDDDNIGHSTENGDGCPREVVHLGRSLPGPEEESSDSSDVLTLLQLWKMRLYHNY